MSNENLIKRLQDWSDGPDTDDLCREAADALTAQANSLGFLRQISEQQAYEINQQAAEIEALRADVERLDWCLERLFTADSGWLTTDTGCGCCGEGLSFEGMTGRAAIDAAMKAVKAVES